jgi:hypothetical protein
MGRACNEKYNIGGKISHILLGDRGRYGRMELRWMLWKAVLRSGIYGVFS